MKIRSGFVTNSSSTNFLIISKEELTEEYLLKKLGFTDSSPIINSGHLLVSELMRGIENGVRWYDIPEINYDAVLDIFGRESAEKYLKLNKKGFFAYVGHTNSDDECLAAFLTMDHFEIDNHDFYMNGLNCVW